MVGPPAASASIVSHVSLHLSPAWVPLVGSPAASASFVSKLGCCCLPFFCLHLLGASGRFCICPHFFGLLSLFPSLRASGWMSGYLCFICLCRREGEVGSGIGLVGLHGRLGTLQSENSTRTAERTDINSVNSSIADISNGVHVLDTEHDADANSIAAIDTSIYKYD